MEDEIIKVNAKTYYSQEYVDNIKTKTSKKASFKNRSYNYTDNNNIMAVGSVELMGEWFKVNIGVSYLKRMITAIEQLDFDNVITLVLGFDVPLGMGNVKGNKFSGILVAPIKDND